MNIKWNADKYTQDFSFVHEYGNEVIGLINREEGASVLDLGCGNGALTKKLSELGFKASGWTHPRSCFKSRGRIIRS